MDSEEEALLIALRKVEIAVLQQTLDIHNLQTKVLVMTEIIRSQNAELRRHRKREQLRNQKAGKTEDIIAFKSKLSLKTVAPKSGSETLDTLELQDLIRDLQALQNVTIPTSSL